MGERDFLAVFEALVNAGVRFIVVGGTAVVLHGHLRVTADLDLVVSLDPPNVLAAVDALERLGFRPSAPIQARDFAVPSLRKAWVDDKGMVVFSMWNPEAPGLSVDLFVEEPFPFEAAYQRALKVALGSVQVAVASIPDLIALKREADRPVDRLDIDALEAIARILESDGPDGE